MRLLKIVAVLSFLSATNNLEAATWYVSTSGSDSNGGSLSAPFRTINKAATVAQPGDEVHVRGGVYNGLVSISSKGTASARIVFRSYPGELAILDGSGTESGKDLVTFYKAAYVDFTGFEVRNATRIGISSWGSNNLRIAGNDVHRSVRNGIYAGYSSFGVSTDIAIENNRIHENVLENEFQTLSGGGWAAAVVIASTDRGTIANNHVFSNYGEGIDAILSDNVRISGNTVADSFSVGIYLDNAQQTVVDGNLVYSTGDTRFYRSGYPASGIQMANESYSTSNPLSDINVINNVAFNTRWGFYYGNYETGGGMKNVVVANNTFYNAAQAIIEITSDAHSNSFVENNIFYKGSSANVAGGGVTYRHNNWYATTAGSASGSGDVLADPLLVNAGGWTATDYQLSASSPLLEKGIASAQVAHDYWKTERSTGFDIGAHELTAATLVDSEAPTAPSQLTATASDSSSVALSWTASSDNVGVTSYQIYRDNAYAATVNGTSWTDTGLAAATSYSYQVYAYDAAGNQSPGSNVASATTKSEPVADAEAPTAPTNLRVTGVATTTVDLAWNASSDNVGVVAYRIYRNGTHVATTTSGTTWRDSRLKRGTTYSYKVTAVDGAGNESPASNTVSATTLKK